jgi:hypothetical protein
VTLTNCKAVKEDEGLYYFSPSKKYPGLDVIERAAKKPRTER